MSHCQQHRRDWRVLATRLLAMAYIYIVVNGPTPSVSAQMVIVSFIAQTLNIQTGSVEPTIHDLS